VGALVGLALYNSVLLDVRFPLALFKKLKGEPPALADLDDFQPALARSLRALLAYSGPDDVADVFALDFTVTTEAYGVRTTTELAPGGAAVPVTAANRRAYVHAYLRWLLVDAVARPFDAFARGFKMVADGPALALFRADELSLLLAGSPHLDFAALERTARYEPPFAADHRVVRWLWAAVHAAPPDVQRKFLAFTTGYDRSPINGLGDVKMVVQRAGPDSESLPTASTCFNTLLLPVRGAARQQRGEPHTPPPQITTCLAPPRPAPCLASALAGLLEPGKAHGQAHEGDRRGVWIRLALRRRLREGE